MENIWISISVGLLVTTTIIYLIVSLSAPNRAWVLKDNLRYALLFIILLLMDSVWMQIDIMDLEKEVQIAESKFEVLKTKGIEIDMNGHLYLGNTVSIDVEKICSDRSKSRSTE